MNLQCSHQPSILSSPDIQEMLQIIHSFIWGNWRWRRRWSRKGTRANSNCQLSRRCIFQGCNHAGRWTFSRNTQQSVSPLLKANLIPDELFKKHDKREIDYNAPMRMFVYAVTRPHLQELLSEEDIIKGANALLRRQALESRGGKVRLDRYFWIFPTTPIMTILITMMYFRMRIQM